MDQSTTQSETRPRAEAESLPGGGKPLLEALRAEADREKIYHEVYQRYYRRVYKRFDWRGFSAEDCADLTQETFLRFYRGIPKFRGQAQPETWLFEIVKNVWHNEIRTRHTLKRKGREISQEEILDGSPDDNGDGSAFLSISADRDPLEDLLVEERAGLLRDAVEQLPPKMRRCILLLLDQDLKYREIAVLEQVSVDTVKSQLAQARQRIKLHLGAYYDGVDDRKPNEARHEAEHRES